MASMQRLVGNIMALKNNTFPAHSDHAKIIGGVDKFLCEFFLLSLHCIFDWQCIVDQGVMRCFSMWQVDEITLLWFSLAEQNSVKYFLL